MWQLGPALEDVAGLAARWRAATPFPHLVFEDVAPDPDALRALLEEEPVERYTADLYAFDASAPEPRSPELRALREGFAAALAAPLSRLTGRTVTRVDMRAYAYRPGDYLLPHTDHQDELGRVLAYAYYLPSPEPPDGGELELYACTLEGGALARAESATVITPRANRLVVFEVGDTSLHQVREVLGGLRLSLAGWFYP